MSTVWPALTLHTLLGVVLFGTGCGSPSTPGAHAPRTSGIVRGAPRADPRDPSNDPPCATCTRVLFVGNSITYYHLVPEIVGALAAATPGVELQVQNVTVPSATLEQHWSEGVVQQLLETERWDFVVLQEQSSQPHYFSAKFEAALGKLVELARRRGAEPILMQQWSSSGEWPELEGAFAHARKRFGLRGSPVGSAWLRAPSGLELYFSDHNHANEQGAYLTACVLYATLLGRSPEGNSLRVIQSFADVPNTPTAFRIDDDTATTLQKIAWATVAPARPTPVRLSNDPMNTLWNSWDDDWLQVSCDGGSRHACAQLSWRLFGRGKEPARDLPRAVTLMRSSCAQGVLFSCTQLGIALLAGHKGVVKDPVEARKLIKLACAAEDKGACAVEAELVGMGQP